MTKIKRVGPDFDLTLAELWRTTFEQAYRETHTAANIAAYCEANYTRAAAKETLSDPKTVCKIAGPFEAPLGFYVVKAHPCPIKSDGQDCELKQIYLLEKAYGTGLGQKLFDDAVSAARDLGAQTLWLSVSDLNQRAQTFYQKLGFERIGTGPVFEVGTDRLPSSILSRQIL